MLDVGLKQRRYMERLSGEWANLQINESANRQISSLIDTVDPDLSSQHPQVRRVSVPHSSKNRNH